jgi:hypothetical protein
MNCECPYCKYSRAWHKWNYGKHTCAKCNDPSVDSSCNECGVRGSVTDIYYGLMNTHSVFYCTRKKKFIFPNSLQIIDGQGFQLK